MECEWPLITRPHIPKSTAEFAQAYICQEDLFLQEVQSRAAFLWTRPSGTWEPHPLDKGSGGEMRRGLIPNKDRKVWPIYPFKGLYLLLKLLFWAGSAQIQPCHLLFSNGNTISFCYTIKHCTPLYTIHHYTLHTSIHCIALYTTHHYILHIIYYTLKTTIQYILYTLNTAIHHYTLYTILQNTPLYTIYYVLLYGIYH